MRSLVAAFLLSFAAFISGPNHAVAEAHLSERLSSLRVEAPEIRKQEEEIRQFLALDDTVDISMSARGILTLDFQDGGIPAYYLEQIIFSLAHLPEQAYPNYFVVPLSGLVLQNGNVEGRLRLSGFTVPFRLRLQDFEFEAAADPTTAPLVSLDGVVFKKDLAFIGTIWHGDMHVIRSDFKASLSIERSEFYRRSARIPAAQIANFSRPLLQLDKNAFAMDLRLIDLYMAPVYNAMKIYDNTVGASFKMEGARFGGAVTIGQNRIADLEVVRTTFSGFFSVRQNQIGQCEIKGGWVYSDLFFNQNTIKSDLVVNNVQFLSYKSTSDLVAVRLQIALNNIGSELYFSPSYIRVGLEEILLNHNHIGRLSVIEVPHIDAFRRPAAPVVLDLTFSNVQGPLVVRERFVPTSRAEQIAAEVAAVAATFGTRSVGVGAAVIGGGAAGNWTGELNRSVAGGAEEGLSDYCYEAKDDGDVWVDVRDTKVERLIWDLPVGTCRYRWRGGGMTFGQFGEAASQGEALLKRLEAWKYQMAEPDPTFFLFLSDKLRAQGSFEASRSMLQEAKRLDYAPRGCVLRELRFWSDSHCVRSGLVYLFLLPTGFGARPELALVWVAASVVIGYVVYKTYGLNRRMMFMYRIWTWLEHRFPMLAKYHRVRWLYLALFSTEPGRDSGEATIQERQAPRGAGFEPRKPKRHGATAVAGFEQYDRDIYPKSFPVWIFNLDAALPVLNFHAYESYYPDNMFVRVFSYAQHAWGWWMLTVFVASLAIL